MTQATDKSFWRKEMGAWGKRKPAFFKKWVSSSPACLSPLSLLIRWRIALAAAFSGLAGYACGDGSDSGLAAILFFSLYGLAASCSIFNQVQERKEDALWPRTAGRPLPRGVLSCRTALLFGLSLLLPSLAVLALIKVELGALGLAVAAIYNGLYTPLKKLGWPALFCGAAAGAMPPLFGWLAAGKNATDLFIMALLAVIFTWQIPHVLLRTLRDNKAKGMPSRPPAPNLPEKSLLFYTHLSFIFYSLALALLALASTGFSIPARLGWLGLALMLTILPILPLKERQNIKIIDGSMCMALLLGAVFKLS